MDAMIIPTAAALTTTKVPHPRYLSRAVFTHLSITLWLLVRRIASRIRGGPAPNGAASPCFQVHTRCSSTMVHLPAQLTLPGMIPVGTRAVDSLIYLGSWETLGTLDGAADAEKMKGLKSSSRSKGSEPSTRLSLATTL